MISDKKLLLKYLRDCLLFVFPSRVEALSMQLLEGISMKAPTIASDIRANTDVFSDSEMLFFKSEDAGDLCTKINYALSHPDQMTTYCEAAYARLLKNYTWDIIARQYDDEYVKF